MAARVDWVEGDLTKANNALPKSAKEERKRYRDSRYKQGETIRFYLNKYLTQFGTDGTFKLLDDWQPVKVAYNIQAARIKKEVSKDDGVKKSSKKGSKNSKNSKK